MIRFLLTVILLLVVNINLYAQTSDSLRILKLESEMASIISEKKQEKLTDSLKLIVYEQKIESLSNELKNTNLTNNFAVRNVHWVVGANLTVIAILVALGIWNFISNNKINKSKFDEIKKDIGDTVNEKIVDIDKKAKEMSEENMKQAGEIKTQLEKTIDNRIKISSEKLNKELGYVEASTYVNRIVLSEMINRNKDEYRYYRRIENRSRIEVLAEELRLEIMIDKKNPSFFERNKSIYFHTWVKDRLKSIHSYVEKNNINLTESDELQKVLEMVPTHYSKIVDLIIKSINLNGIDDY